MRVWLFFREYKRYFYCHEVTGDSQWDFPGEEFSQQMSAEDGNGAVHEHEATTSAGSHSTAQQHHHQEQPMEEHNNHQGQTNNAEEIHDETAGDINENEPEHSMLVVDHGPESHHRDDEEEEGSLESNMSGDGRDKNNRQPPASSFEYPSEGSDELATVKPNNQEVMQPPPPLIRTSTSTR